MASGFSVSLHEDEKREEDDLLAPIVSREKRSHHCDKRHRAVARSLSARKRECAAQVGNIVVRGIFSADHMVRPRGEHT